MFNDVDETLRVALTADVPIQKNEVEIAFDQPSREWSSRLTKPTLSLFLYDVRERTDFKDDVPVVMRNVKGQAVRQIPPRRIDLAYLITAWAKEPDDEHRILGRVLASLYRLAEIKSEYWQGDLKYATYPLLTRVTPIDELFKPHDMWGVLDNEIRTGLSWIVTAPLDVFKPIEGPMVRTREIRVAQTGQPADAVLGLVGGFAHRKGDPLSVVAGVKITVAGTGFAAETNAAGQFRFNLPAGEYTWRIQPPEGKAHDKKVTVPSANYDIEV